MESIKGIRSQWRWFAIMCAARRVLAVYVRNSGFNECISSDNSPWKKRWKLRMFRLWERKCWIENNFSPTKTRRCFSRLLRLESKIGHLLPIYVNSTQFSAWFGFCNSSMSRILSGVIQGSCQFPSIFIDISYVQAPIKVSAEIKNR